MPHQLFRCHQLPGLIMHSPICSSARSTYIIIFLQWLSLSTVLQVTKKCHGPLSQCMTVQTLHFANVRHYDGVSHRPRQNLHTLFHKGMQIPLKQYGCEFKDTWYLSFSWWRYHVSLIAIHTNFMKFAHHRDKNLHGITKEYIVACQGAGSPEKPAATAPTRHGPSDPIVTQNVTQYRGNLLF